MHLALVVPALNEEEAIGDTLRRAVAARARVLDQTPVTRMTVVFVNDGSTDRTQEIVDQVEFDEVLKVRFESNRGYGVAIKAGWMATDADLLGFIDADGTCDPDLCVELVNRLESTQADVVLGARLTKESRMPPVRWFGNVVMARLLGLVSGRHLTDCASGFRIVRRSSLPSLAPLPDGLHFTPGMSAICLLDHRLKIEEVPFFYQERIGRSKLSVIKDGFRFLYTILFTACCYTPLKTMFVLGLIGLVLSGLLATATSVATGASLPPLAMMIAALFVFVFLIAGGLVFHQMNYLLLGPRRKLSVIERAMQHTLHHYQLIVVGLVVLTAGMIGLAVLPWFVRVASPAAIAGMIALGLLCVAGAAAAIQGAIARAIWTVGEKHKALLQGAYLAPSPTRSSQDPKSSVQQATAHSPSAEVACQGTQRVEAT